MAGKNSGKPWLHEATGIWCTSDHGKRIYLDKDYKVACRKFRELIAARKRQQQLELQGVSEDWLNRTLADLSDEYLDDVKARKKPSSYRYG